MASIVGQTYRDLEIILVDDASPDGCPQMCDRWAGRDSRIRVLHVPHGGLSCARNAGLDAARGEFIVFVDSDDTIAPAMCERLLSAQAATGADIVFCDVVRRLPEGDRIAEPFPFPVSPSSLSGKAVFLDDFFHSPAKRSRLVPVWNKLYRRSVFDGPERLRFPQDRIFEDHRVSYKAFYGASIVAGIPDPLYHYVSRSGSITDSESLTTLEERLAVIPDMLAWARGKDDETRLVTEHGAYYMFFSALRASMRVPGSEAKSALFDRFWNLLLIGTSPYLGNPKANRKVKLAYVLYRLGVRAGMLAAIARIVRFREAFSRI